MTKFIAFLRGINVGGHHKVPMADLRELMEKLGYQNITTILNSGNIIFEAREGKSSDHENELSVALEKSFGFPVPVVVRKASEIEDLISNNPFMNLELTKTQRFYVSFLKTYPEPNQTLPWTTEDGSFKIMENKEKIVFSILDVAVTKTPKGMEALEKFYGKDITTRNWNTINRIHSKL